MGAAVVRPAWRQLSWPRLCHLHSYLRADKCVWSTHIVRLHNAPSRGRLRLLTGIVINNRGYSPCPDPRKEDLVVEQHKCMEVQSASSRDMGILAYALWSNVRGVCPCHGMCIKLTLSFLSIQLFDACISKQTEQTVDADCEESQHVGMSRTGYSASESCTYS